MLRYIRWILNVDVSIITFRPGFSHFLLKIATFLFLSEIVHERAKSITLLNTATVSSDARVGSVTSARLLGLRGSLVPLPKGTHNTVSRQRDVEIIARCL
jgi:hypothetical protein